MTADTNSPTKSGKPATVEEYLAAVPDGARPAFEQLRTLTFEALDELVQQGTLAGWQEKVSYGILGYAPARQRRAFAFISAFKDHVGIYPVPAAPQLQAEAARYRRGKGTLWFPLNQRVPRDFIKAALTALMTA